MDKKAFVFDTNLDEALDKLKEQFSLYITQVSIDERIAQNCRELKIELKQALPGKT